MKKSKNSQKKPAAKKKSQTEGIAPSMKAASAISGYRYQTLQIAKENGCNAFNGNGTVDLAKLDAWIKQNPDIIAQAEDMPDIKVEKALRARVNRIEDEVRLQKTLENVASLDLCRRILVRGGKLLLTKAMIIPDRVSEIFSLETDSLKIRERMIQEIADAFRSISPEDVEKLVKEVLEQ